MPPPTQLPRPLNPGEAVIWVEATAHSPTPQTYRAGGGGGGIYAEGVYTLTTSTMFFLSGNPLGDPLICIWSGFTAAIQSGTVINNIYPTVVVSTSFGIFQQLLCGVDSFGPSGPDSNNFGTSIDTLTGATIQAELWTTAPGSSALDIDYVGMAVYIELPPYIRSFQYPSGEPVANGYLLVSLDKDCKTSEDQQISSDKITRVQLDSDGSASGFLPFFNADLTPDDSSYVISVYSSSGQLVRGPYLDTRE